MGEVFDDRAPSGENRTSIVRVACCPPSSSERWTSARFGSLMPESSARPKKRSFQCLGPDFVPNALGLLPTTEGLSSQQSPPTVDEQNKKRKLHQYQHLSGAVGSNARGVPNLSHNGLSHSHMHVRGSQNSAQSEGVSEFLKFGS